jgi:predicted ATPase/class 3 adenylate cyclase
MRLCPFCGEENPDRFRLCGFCGSTLAAEVERQDLRRTVTVVFCDLKGSTNLGERLDSETLREVLNEYFSRMKAQVERHGGNVEKFIGDAIMAVFGLPRGHEDDALRAVKAAADMQRALAELNTELELGWGLTLANRTGINTGEVVAGNVTQGHRLVTGDAVNVAARLEQAAGEGEIIIGENTFRLVRDSVEVEALKPLTLKGKADPVPAFRLVSIVREERPGSRDGAGMVGRDAERTLLVDRFQLAVRDHRPQLVTIVGQAGVGKSRLIQEFLLAVGSDVRTLRGRCLPYGEGITFWPFAEIVRQAAGIDQGDSPAAALAKLTLLVSGESDGVPDRVAAAIGLATGSFPVDEIFWAARKAIETIAGNRPLILVVDDLHWAESTFLDLIQHVTDLMQGAQVMLVCSTRPDLIEHRPAWGVGENAAQLILEPLSADESERIVDNILGATALPARLRSRVVEAAEGNPLFIQQMVSVLIDEGTVVRGPDGAWILTAEPSDLSIPPSISALLAARLDQLAIEERAVLECGSVIGSVFYVGAVRALAPRGLEPHLGTAFASLMRKQLIRPATSDFAGEEAFRFDHILIRDVAYQGLLKRGRARLHESFATWLEDSAGPRVMEYEEILGYHLEQAFRYRAELASVDESTRELGDRAAERLRSAGRRAFTRGDMPAAAHLLERAVTLYDVGDLRRLTLIPDLGEALMDIGELGRADAWLKEAIEAAISLGDRRLQMEATTVRLLFAHSTGAEVADSELLLKAREAIAVLEEEGDHAALAKAWRCIVMIQGTACRYEAAEEAIRQVIHHSRAAGDQRQETRILPSYALAAMYGPTPVPKAIERCTEVIQLAGEDQRAQAWGLAVLSVLNAMQERFVEARDLYGRSRALFEELGQRLLASQISLFSSRVEMLAGDYVAAERELRRDFEALTAMGERYFLANVAPLLAQTICLQGRYDEAERLSRAGEEATTENDIEAQALWRRARAEVLARQGRFTEAGNLCQQAVALLTETDGLDLQASTLMDLAEIYSLSGRPEDAVSVAREALSLYERKGNRASTARTQAFLASPDVADALPARSQ